MARVFESAGGEAARIAGRSAAMDAVAAQLMVRAKAEAAKNSRTGAFVRGIRVVTVRGRNGALDRLVVADREGAAAIEFGHLAVFVSRGGRRARTQWVQGKHSMRNAYLSMPGAGNG